MRDDEYLKMVSGVNEDLLGPSSEPKTYVVSIKPMLFIGSDFYPFGGWEDFVGYFDSVEDAKQIILKQEYAYDLWAHVVVDGKIVLKANTTEKLGDEKWKFTEIE